jgi:hypothetical protein
MSIGHYPASRSIFDASMERSASVQMIPWLGCIFNLAIACTLRASTRFWCAWITKGQRYPLAPDCLRCSIIYVLTIAGVVAVSL